MQISPASLSWWASMGFKPATSEEIARVRAAIGPEVAPDYLAFLQDHGFVEWDIDIPDSFEYATGTPGQQVTTRMESITHLWPVDHIERMAAAASAAGAGSAPQLTPNTHFPIGGTAGQSQILLELKPEPGRIWFWAERQDPWGTGDNTELGFVADSFTGFIEGLKLLD